MFYRIDLRTGNLQVLRLCRYYYKPMAVGRDKVVMCRLLFPEPSKFIILSPHSTATVLCGQKQMTEEVTSVLVADGVSTENILKNF